VKLIGGLKTHGRKKESIEKRRKDLVLVCPSTETGEFSKKTPLINIWNEENMRRKMPKTRQLEDSVEESKGGSKEEKRPGKKE